METTTATPTDTLADDLHARIREALVATQEHGYQQGRFTSGAGDEGTERAELDQRAGERDAAVQALWTAFYGFASR